MDKKRTVQSRRLFGNVKGILAEDIGGKGKRKRERGAKRRRERGVKGRE